MAAPRPLNGKALARLQMGLAEDIAAVGRLLDEWQAGRAPLYTVAPPQAVRVGELNPDGWGEWQMIPSPVSSDDVDRLEREIGVRLPPFYRAFLSCRVVLDLDFGDYTLPSIWPRDALVDVRQYLSASVGDGFVQFGSARGCGDPLCFDMMDPAQDGDCQVVVFNHDFVPSAAWGVRTDLQRYAAVVAPTFRAFLTSLLSGDPGIFPPPQSPAELQTSLTLGRGKAG